MGGGAPAQEHAVGNGLPHLGERNDFLRRFAGLGNDGWSLSRSRWLVTGLLTRGHILQQVFLGHPATFASAGDHGQVHPVVSCQLFDSRRIVLFARLLLLSCAHTHASDPVDDPRCSRLSLEPGE